MLHQCKHLCWRAHPNIKATIKFEDVFLKTVEIYTTPTCGYCQMAKRLLMSKDVPFEEIDVSRDPNKRKEMMSKSGGGHTVPQIFIGDIHVGGCDDLYALERAQKLDAFLA